MIANAVLYNVFLEDRTPDLSLFGQS